MAWSRLLANGRRHRHHSLWVARQAWREHKMCALSTGTGTTQFEGSLVGLARAQDIPSALTPTAAQEQIVLAQLQAEHKLMCTLSPQPSAPAAEQLFGHSCVRDTHSFDRYQAYH